jgi:hypothetical protein
MMELDEKIPYECVISEDASTLSVRDPVIATAKRIFRTVHCFTYPTPKIQKWPEV